MKKIFSTLFMLIFCMISIFFIFSTNASATYKVGPDPIIWESNYITFTKAPWADWTLAENQDRITENVWLTRQDIAGLFNIHQEENYRGWYTSPVDTEWAFSGLRGNPYNVTASNHENLVFDSWAYALDTYPPDSIDRPGVLHLISDNIYLNITFRSWSVGEDGGGGFSYERATAPVPVPPSLFLLAPGLVGIIAVRRRFKK